MLNVNVPQMKRDDAPLTCSLVGELESMGFTDVLVMDSQPNVITCNDKNKRKVRFSYNAAVVYATWSKRRLISHSCRRTSEGSVGIEFVYHVPNGQKHRYRSLFDPHRAIPSWDKVKNKADARRIDGYQARFHSHRN